MHIWGLYTNIHIYIYIYKINIPSGKVTFDYINDKMQNHMIFKR